MALDSVWIDVALAVLCLAVALGYVVAAVTAAVQAAIGAAHALMGVGMTAMFVPTLDVVPRGVWFVAFALVAAWFTAVALRRGVRVEESGHHIVGAVAMIYMLFAHDAPSGATEAGHAHHGGSGTVAGPPALVSTAVALLLAAYFVAHVVRHLLGRAGHEVSAPAVPAPPRDGVAAVRTAGVRTAVRTAVRPDLRRYIEPAGHVVMGSAMAYTLLAMA